MAGFERHADMVHLVDRLSARGYGETDIAKVLGENFLRVFAQVWGGMTNESGYTPSTSHFRILQRTLQGGVHVKGKLIKFLAGFMLVFMLAACGTKVEDPAPTPTGGSSNPSPQTPATQYEDTFRFSGTADAVTLDPHEITDNTSDNVAMMIYDRLVKFDEQLDIVPDLAEKWSVSEDGRTWTFNLRTGVKFHDGTPFDANAVKKTFDRVMDPELNLKRRSLFSMIEKVEVIDPQTVAFTTDEPFGAFLATMAHTSSAIISPAAIEKYGMDLGQNPVGTGAYTLEHWRKDEELVLTRNEEYWGQKGATKTLIYKPIPDTQSRIIALQTGETDLISHVPATDLKRFQDDKAFKVLTVTSNGQRQFRFNHAKEIWNDPRVRQAVSYAIDRKSILENVMGNNGTLSVGPLSPVTWGAPNFGPIPYDPDKARQLLADAGYPNGFSINLITTARYDMGVEVAEAIQAQLGKVGIQAKLEVVEWGVFVGNLGGKKPEELAWDFFIMGAGPSTGDADWGLRPIFTTQPTNENNYGFYSNQEFDDLIFAAMAETDQDKRLDLYKRAGEIVYMTDPGAVWLYDTPLVLVSSAKVDGVSMIPVGHTFLHKATRTK